MNVVQIRTPLSHTPPRPSLLDDGEAARRAFLKYGARPEDIPELESWLPARMFVAVVEMAVAHGHMLASGQVSK